MFENNANSMSGASENVSTTSPKRLRVQSENNANSMNGASENVSTTSPKRSRDQEPPGRQFKRRCMKIQVCCDRRYRLPIYLPGAKEAIASLRTPKRGLSQEEVNFGNGWGTSGDVPDELKKVLSKYKVWNNSKDVFHGTWCASNCPGKKNT